MHKRVHVTKHKMKKWIFLFFTLLAINNVNSQISNEKAFIESLIEKIKISKSKFQNSLSRIKKYPAEKNQYIVFLPYTFEKDNEGYESLNYYLLKVNTQGEILSSNLFKNLENEWNWSLEDITIDTGKYYLNSETRAFGLRIKHVGGSNVNSATVVDLNLFIEKSGEILKLTNDIRILHETSESSGGCSNSSHIDNKSILIIEENTNNIYNDVKIVTEEVEYYLSDDCETQHDLKKKPKIIKKYVFDAKVGKYVL